MNNIELSTSMRDFLNVIFKHKGKIVTFFLVTVAIVTVGSFVMKSVYEATSQVLVKLGRENIYVPTAPTAAGASPIFSFSREEQINSEIEILKSRYLLEKVVDSLGAETIYPDLVSDGNPSLLKKVTVLPILKNLIPERWGTQRTSPRDQALLRLRKKVSVEGVKKSDVIDVSFQSHDPTVAKDVVNTLVRHYLDHHLTVHRSPMAYDFFRNQASLLEARLRDSERELEAFREGNAITSLEEQRTLVLRKAADLNAELKATLSQVQEAKTKMAKLKEQLSRLSPNVELEKSIGGNPYVINTLKAKLAELELQEQELLTKYTEKSRLVVNVRKQIQTVKQKLAREEGSLYGSSRSGINVTYRELERELFSEEAGLKALQAREKSQHENLGAYDGELERLNHIEARFNHLQRQVEINHQNYKLYLTKLEESRISNAMDMEKIANVSVIQPALTPLKPIKPRRLLNIILAIILGGIGGLGIAFFGEYLDHSFKTREEVENILNLPVLASIPGTPPHHRSTAAPNRRKTAALQHRSTNSFPHRGIPPRALDEFEKLKSQIHVANGKRPIRTLMIVSCGDGEGASTVAAGLSGILGKETTDRILLVDANFRTSSVHKRFDKSKKDGLTDLIKGRANLEWVIKRTEKSNIYMVTSGNHASSALGVFDTTRMDMFLQFCREKFKYAVFDSAPCNAFPDPSILAPKMDGVILVVEAEKTRWEVAQKAKEELEKAGARILGVVLNKRKYYIPRYIYRRL